MKNVEFLKDQMKFTGFGEGYESELKEKIGKNLPEFQINHRTEYGPDVVTATLDFSKSKSSDLYFFNGYKIELKPEGNQQTMSQTFRVGNSNNITLKEAYNMMNGRAIYKEFNKMEKQGEGENARFKATDEKYHGWKQMNFKETTKSGNFKLETFTDAYGFDLKEALQRLPFKESENELATTRLTESLQKGNRPMVTLEVNGKQEQYTLVANPRFKRLDVYDGSNQKIDLGQGKTNKQKQDKSQKLPEDAAMGQKNKTKKTKALN